MRVTTQALLVALSLSSIALVAQATVDPSGHWEGIVSVPNMEMKIEVDLARNSQGALVGTFGHPAQGVKGLPLATITVEARSVRFVLKAGTEVSTFVGAVSADGKTMAGQASQGEHSVPFSLTRTGDARIAAAPKSPSISKELEGTWNGTIEAGAKQVHLVLKMANHADGTATGTIVSLDGGGIEIPITMTQQAANVTIVIPSVGVSYVAALNTSGTELIGTWTERSAALPLTFRRGKQ